MLNTGYILDGKYEVVDILGQGGMSTVYLCKNTRLGNLWAVKEVKKEVREYMDFLTEPNILKNLSHPGIPRIVDIFYEQDNLYIVEDYIKGETLEGLVKREGQLSDTRICDITLKLCDIIGYLHSFNPPIIYRDLKPSNIMITPNGGVVLIDFGISRTYKDECEGDTVFMGTKGYAAPEQYGAGQSDIRTDIYGIGATMYFMSSGQIPPYAVLMDENMKDFIDTRLVQIIKRAVEIDAKNRYASVEDMKNSIAAFLNYSRTVITSGNRMPPVSTVKTEIMNRDVKKVENRKDAVVRRVPRVAITVITCMLIAGALGMAGAQNFLGDRSKKPGDTANNSQTENVESAKTAVTPTPTATPTPTPTPTIVTPTPVKDIFIQGVIDTKNPEVVKNYESDKESEKNKPKNKTRTWDEVERYYGLYRVTPQAAAGRFENKFIIKIQYVEQRDDTITVYCTADNSTGKTITISGRNTYLKSEDDYKRATLAGSGNISIPQGARNQILSFEFADSDIEPGQMVMKTIVTSSDQGLSNKEIMLSITVK